MTVEENCRVQFEVLVQMEDRGLAAGCECRAVKNRVEIIIRRCDTTDRCFSLTVGLAAEERFLLFQV